MSAPLVFIDTETTGVHPEREAWEVAMIRRDDRGQREIQFFIEVDLDKADPFGLKVGGFYDRHPIGRILSGQGESGVAHRPIGAAQEIARWTYGAHIVGAVPNFDSETIDRLLRRYNLIPAWHYHLIDVEAMAIGYLARDYEVDKSNKTPLQPPWKSDEIARACGVAPPSDEERHTAMGDARWAMRWYDAMTGGVA